MMRILNRALVSTAARRWPDSSQTRREWLAELEFLATQRRPLRGLSYALGLVFARPGHAPAIGLSWRTLGTALFLLAGPFMLAVVLTTVGLFLVRVAPVVPKMDASPQVYWAYSAVFVIAGFLAGRWWGARSVLIGPAPLALGLGLSVSVSFLLAPLGANAYTLYLDQLEAGRVWVPALFLMIFLVARAAQRGWGGRAMLAALLAWFVVLDIAVMVMFWPSIGVDTHAPGGYMFEAEHAPYWFLAALANDPLGLVNPVEMFQIADDAALMPQALITLAVYAMSYAVAAVRASKAVPVAAVA